MPATQPSPAAMLWRGLTRRCPACGSGRLFRRYFRVRAQCPRCGLRVQRLEGQWSGDIGINTIATFSLLFVLLLGGTLLMWNDLNVVLLAVMAGAVALIFPVLFVPFAKTTWLAIDLIMRPLEADEIRERPDDDGASSK